MDSIEEIQQKVAGVIAGVLEDSSFVGGDADRSILYRGVDSLRALELSACLQTEFDLGPDEVPNTFVFENPTVRQAAETIAAAIRATASASTTLEFGSPTPLSSGDDEDDNQAGSEKARLAIVGISCRLPGGAVSPERYWDILNEGVDGVTEIPAHRLDLDRLVAEAKVYVRKGAFVSDVEHFDHEFFGIPASEAEAMDPQQRLTLHVVYESLSRAGWNKQSLAGLEAGVFVGNSAVEWSDVQPEAALHGVYGRSGTASAVLANRVSHVLGLGGVSVTVDSACSSSLVAVDLACQALREGRCQVAVAAGVHLHLSERRWIQLCSTKMLSPSARCRAFDAQADGMVRGEGVAAVAIMPLHLALAQGRPVHGVILGSWANHAGKAANITTPTGQSQRRAVSAALRSAKVRPSQVSYVEAHGTGTALGDPIELGALASVFSADSAVGGDDAKSSNEEELVIGSAKASIGHLESASGLAGLIKAIFVLKQQQATPQLHLGGLNPEIERATRGFHFRIVTPESESRYIAPKGQLTDEGKETYGVVSSFGFSGTNACVVLAAPPGLSSSNSPDAPITSSLGPGVGKRFLMTPSGREHPLLLRSECELLDSDEKLVASTLRLGPYSAVWDDQLGTQCR
ncbi:Polyketide synthase PksL [Lasiodiplodia theobromae]|uniref:Polyketide synthase PksL n=1 Tax=Lasiodiplodia theobromae TaxID=45133 RepID=A0A5N5DE13_9PEZI|nr:Polyketide synthase PksL [Lasiodiplodia theobromae]